MRLSRIMRQVAAVVFALELLVAVSIAADRGQDAPLANASSSSAAQFVRRALVAEAAGETDRRAEYLKDALAADPDYAPAHWQSGEVRVGDRWLPVQAAAAENSWSGKFTRYRQLREQSPATVDAHLRLARWCADNGLADQERIHLANALQLRPAKQQQREIINKLGLVRYQKQLVTSATAEALKKQAKVAESSLQKWKPILTRLRGDLESRDAERQQTARDQLVANQDVAAIPAIEAVFSKSTPEAGRVAIGALANMRQQAATDSLVRHALFAKHEEVRKAAAEALKPRDVFSYVPLLLANLNAPIEVSYQVYSDGSSLFNERLSLFREGPLYNVSYVSGNLVAPVVRTNQANERGQAGTSLFTIPTNAGQVINSAKIDEVFAANAVAENARTEFMNERVAAALQVATGNDFDASPKPWWDWWAEFNEQHYPQQKPTYEQARFVNPQSISHSCFVPGTKVWTVTGTMPIENVQAGDWVLAQAVDTGEVTYKPVSATTKGPPLPIVEIRAGDEVIRSTVGHLFWVAGSGWRMAKELAAGDRLHTTKGALTIESVEKTGEAACHNLIVPEFNTYFVTDRQILVHDIDIRGPTTATVPGLLDP